MYIVAIAWIYVVLLMAMTEPSFIAGFMTLIMYCVFPLSIVLYLMRTSQRKQKRIEKQAAPQQIPSTNEHASEQIKTGENH
ncbi:hypothetical protein [Undibacterium oligocarboniphilum]|uniref:Transmembrane protein n=1 Tax=Undibacterium oligocarboniphilum TaxID=666702 RepID=A0A850QB14_9BURK|nr:hypothetical protein [Undibacterium oligocarboniphilum]MBC3868790.1 hypothetical protein [Undibacterium oligocarboniphilum]NVO76771.1 hypothetical protein [Undibacterium oligocarboniphilum]